MSGNHTSYLGNTLTWSMGRQLASFNDIEFTYDENGIRTSKTVDDVKTMFYLDGTRIIEQTDGTTTLYFIYDSNSEVIGFRYNESDYFYVKNVMGDVVGMADIVGNLVASYTYDAWGKVTSVTGSNTELGNLNPFRYRSYYYDTETELYYLQSRYYDLEVGRFINSDDVSFIGTTGLEISYNSFAYCENNPVNKEDPSGYYIETILDITSIGWSIYQLMRAPSWINLGYLVWDVASAFIPFAPGSYTARGGKVLLKVADDVSDFKNSKVLTAGTYASLRQLFKKIKGIEIHHIIEKRFRLLFKVDADEFLSIPLTKELHKEITKRWRKVYGYGKGYKNITKNQMRKMINEVYKDMPELKKVALAWFEKNWIGNKYMVEAGLK